MTKFAAKITSRGRITVDSKVRQELELDEGDWVVAQIEPIENEEGDDNWIF